MLYPYPCMQFVGEDRGYFSNGKILHKTKLQKAPGKKHKQNKWNKKPGFLSCFFESENPGNEPTQD